MKKNIIIGLSLAVVLVLGALAVRAQSTTYDLKGWGWSSTTGWVSFNGADSGAGGSYKVSVDSTTGNISGYAWSPNIGWISFNPSVNNTCPAGSGCQPNVDLTTGKVTGWARALAGCQSDLWDGTKCTDSGAGDANGLSAGTSAISSSCI